MAKVFSGGMEGRLTFYRYQRTHWRPIRSTSAAALTQRATSAAASALAAVPNRAGTPRQRAGATW